MNDLYTDVRVNWIKAGMPARHKTILERLREIRDAMGSKWIGHPKSTFEWQRGPSVLK